MMLPRLISKHKKLSTEKVKRFTLSKKIKYTVIIFLMLYYVAISTFQPKGDIEYSLHWGIWLPIVSYVILWEGRSYFKIYKRAVFERVFNMYTLIGLAAHIIYIYAIVGIGVKEGRPYHTMLPWEAPGLLIIVAALGEDIEQTFYHEITRSFEKLQKIRNEKVIKIINNQKHEVAVKELKIGDFIWIPKGQSIPIDGVLMSDGDFDFSNITGESKIRRVNSNSSISSGVYNIGEPVQIQVTTLPKNSTINKIVDAFIKASISKPRLQKLADKLMRIFVVSILGLTLITFIIWLALGLTNNIDMPWNINVGRINSIGRAWEVSIEVAVTVLAIACPCALGIATPIINLVTATALQSSGIVINNPVALENFEKLKWALFDKTGTITTNKLIIKNHTATPKFLQIAKTLESGVNHPIARAFSIIDAEQLTMHNVKYHDGIGIEGIYQNRHYFIKNLKDANSIFTTIGLYEDNQLVAKFELANEIKPGVVETIAYLHERKIKTAMLTGDNDEVARYIAKAVGIQKVHANLTPITKQEIVKKYQSEGKTLFVGDGFNDALASQTAAITVAFSTGSEIVNDFSDFSILSESFNSIEMLVRTALNNSTNIKLALTYALIFNLLAVPAAMLLIVPPWVGALIMTISNLLIISSALIYRYQLKSRIKKLSKR